jgi:Winged helix DNA-binding domain
MGVADWIARRRMRSLGLWGPGLATPADVVGHLTAMQAQEHRYARWSVGQRMKGSPNVSSLDRAFDEGGILRTHALRPTWHYVAPHDLRWLLNLTGPRVNAGNARRYQELGLDAKTLARADDVVAEAVASGPRTRRELADILDAHRISAADQRIAYILMHAELHSVICSGPMRGRQHSYATFDQRVPPGDGPRHDEALAALARRYFSTRGPATLNDFVWWSGLKTSEARRGLAGVSSHLASRVIDDRTYWFTGRSAPPTTPKIDLVQCYDEMIISYSQTRDVLQTSSARFAVPRHIDGFQHVLLLDGRLLGHWRHTQGRHGSRVETRIEKPLNEEERTTLTDAIDRYRRFSDPQGGSRPS